MFVFIISFLFILSVNAETGYVTDSTGVNMRDKPSTKNSNVLIEIPYNAEFYISNTNAGSGNGCSKAWYYVYYNNNYGYICSNLVKIIGEVETTYERPWTSPKKAIVGGAQYISEYYIEKGQYTSYLKKFNVNPSGYYKIYNHQYMANLRAPYSEAYSSYISYRDNNLLSLPLEFTIPVFLNMENNYALPGTNADMSCQSNITDLDFENKLNVEKFPESYRCKLRAIHNTYPNWTFKALHTNLDFNKSVIAEQNVSSIQGGNLYYDLSSGNKIETESGWYRANYDTVAYYLDPRNFLVVESIFMFENLGYSENYTTTVVQSILKGTFMEEYSIIDNQSYADIFVEAGKKANISAVYLASLARQESGPKVTNTTSGAEFTYEGHTYSGLYNFFNIGASSSASNPALAGLVWANGGIGNSNSGNEGSGNTGSDNSIPVLDEITVLNAIGLSKKENCLVGINIGTNLKSIQDKSSNLTIKVNGSSEDMLLKTGQIITFTDGNTTFTYTISVLGDVDGDGSLGAADYVKIKNYIMEKSGSELSIEQNLAADVDGNGSIGATDYVQIKKNIMEG